MPERRECPVCGAVFYSSPSTSKICCSKACMGRRQAALYAAARPVRTCAACGQEYTVKPHVAKYTRYCSRACQNPAQSRATAAKRAATQRYRGKGKSYVKLRGRHMHRAIAEMVIGRPLRPGEVVHHKNGDRRDNRPENLEVLPSQGEHARKHNLARWRKRDS